MRGILIIVFLLCSLVSIAQPGGYTEGTFVNWSFNSRDHGIFKAQGFNAAGATKKRVLFHFEGDGETSSSGLTTQAPGKYLNDAGTNWNGKIALSAGDTIYFMVVTIFNTSGNYTPDYKQDIEYVFSNATNLPDTGTHNYYAITGFSGGVGRLWGTMLESGFAYARVFGLTQSVSTPFLGVDVTTISAAKRNKVWRNSDDANGGTPVGASDNLFADLSGVKTKYYPTTTQGHSADSAMSIYGTDSSTNFWRLVAQYSFAGVPNTPPTANAGADQLITLPTTSATLNGTGSSDPDGTIVTYAWSKVSGGSATITSPSSATTTVTGLSQGVYYFRLAVTDDSSATSADTMILTVSNAQSTTRFYPDATKAFTRNGRKTFDVARLVDGDTLTKVSTTNTSEAFSTPWEGYILFDNYYNGVNFDVWQVGGGGTFFITILTDDNDGHMLETNGALDSGDSLGTYTLDIGGFNTWTHVNLAAYSNVRGLRIRCLTYADKNAQNYEFRMYGDSQSVAPTIYRTPTIVANPDPGKYFHGIGGLDNVNMTLMRKMGWSQRISYFGAIFDSAVHTNATPIGSPSLVYKLDQNGYDAFNTRVFNDARTYGIKTRVYIVGATTRNLSAGLSATYDYANWSNANNYKNIEPGADSVSKAAWAGDARKWYMFTALYGSNASADLTGYIIHGAPTTAGQGGMDVAEIDNEVSKDWPAGGVDVAIAHAQPSVVFTRMDTVYWKVKQADPNMKVVVPALTYLDTVYVKALFFENWLRYGTTRACPWDGFGFNLYINSLYDGQNGVDADTAITAGRWQLISRLQKFNVLMNKLFPNQSTYDITESSGGASNDILASPHNVGTVAGKTDKEIMADNTWRHKKHFQIGGAGYLNTYFYYWYGHDGSYVFDFMSATDQNASFVDTLRIVGKVLTQQNTVETNYTGWATMVTNGDSTGTYVCYQNAVSGSNKLYSVWRETHSNSTASATINLGSGALTATLKQLNYNSETTTDTPLTITGNSVTVTAAELGQYIEVTYAGSTPTGLPRQRGKRIKWVTN